MKWKVVYCNYLIIFEGWSRDTFMELVLFYFIGICFLFLLCTSWVDNTSKKMAKTPLKWKNSIELAVSRTKKPKGNLAAVGTVFLPRCKITESNTRPVRDKVFRNNRGVFAIALKDQTLCVNWTGYQPRGCFFRNWKRTFTTVQYHCRPLKVGWGVHGGVCHAERAFVHIFLLSWN